MATKPTPKTPEQDPAFTVELTILAPSFDAAIDATHDTIMAACRRDGVPAIHEATRAKPSGADSQAARTAAGLATVPEEPDSFEAVARDLWSGMAMGMSLSHYDSAKVHDRLYKLHLAEKAAKTAPKPSRPATEGGAAKLALATLGTRAIEYAEAQVEYRTSKAERTARLGFGAGASDEVLRAAVHADELLGRAAVQYADTVAANKASQAAMEA